MSKMSKTQQLLDSHVEIAAKDGNKFAIASKHSNLRMTDEGEQVEEGYTIVYFLGEHQQSHYQQSFDSADECIAAMKSYNAGKGLRSWRPVSYDFPVKQSC